MKITHLDSISPQPNIFEQELSKNHDYHLHVGKNLNIEEAIESTKGSDIIIAAPSVIRPLSSKLLSKISRLKHLALFTVGTDWVDLDYCKKNQISVSTPVGANSEAVAEHIFGLFLDLSKRISEFDRAVRSRDEFNLWDFTGTELYDKTIGIIGLGNIGKKVARIATGFDMNVLAFDRSERSTQNIEITDLQTLLSSSDYIAVTLPLTNDTQGLISREQIELIKKNAIVANISREGIVDDDSILEAISKKKLAGYGVDTEIMKPVSNKYKKYENVIALPHNAFNTKETDKRVNIMVLQNVLHFISGKPINLVNTD